MKTEASIAIHRPAEGTGCQPEPAQDSRSRKGVAPRSVGGHGCLLWGCFFPVKSPSSCRSHPSPPQCAQAGQRGLRARYRGCEPPEELQLPVGGLGVQCPGVSTYDTDLGHEEQHTCQGHAQAVVTHGVEDGTKFLLPDASEHPTAGTLPGEGEGLGQGASPPLDSEDDPAPCLWPLFQCPCPVMRVTSLLCA